MEKIINHPWALLTAFILLIVIIWLMVKTTDSNNSKKIKNRENIFQKITLFKQEQISFDELILDLSELFNYVYEDQEIEEDQRENLHNLRIFVYKYLEDKNENIEQMILYLIQNINVGYEECKAME